MITITGNMDSMNEAAEVVLRKCMGLKENEQYVVITDEFAEDIGKVLYEEGKKITEDSYLLKVPLQKELKVSTPKVAEEVLKSSPSVVVIPTKNSYTHMDATVEACSNGSRIATLPGVTKEIFQRTLNINYEELRKEGKKLKEKMEKASYAKVKTKSGTDVKLNIPNRIVPDLGEFQKPGKYGNLPTGEIFTAPDEREVNGKIVIDSMQKIAKPKTKVIVYKGEVQEVEGDKGFREKLWSHKNGRNIAELGIGLNPEATIIGNILEDEKVKGTCHIAFGKNSDFGGKIDSDIHWDAILIQPDIWLDEEKIMDSGKLIF